DNVCTDDACNGSGTCAHTPNTASCDDGFFCNGTDTCSGGTCTHSGDPCAGGAECNNTCSEAAHDCHTRARTACTHDGNACTDDVCSNGACGGTPILCDNGQFCDGEEACVGGMCHTVVAAPSCDDGIVCTTNTCDPMANDGHGACVNDPIPGCCSTDAECSDHDLCTGVETCNVRTGICGHGTPVDCNENNVCTLDSCDPMTGMCHFDPQPGCCNTN